jgi:hypothetical protein
LAAPIDGVDFLLQRNDGPVHVANLVRAFADGFVVAR